MKGTSVAAPREARIREILDDLIRQRRSLAGPRVDRGLLEANGMSIAYWQGELSRVRRRRPRPFQGP